MVQHPNYNIRDPDDANAARCECGGILYWHATVEGGGCEDCDCPQFHRAGDEASEPKTKQKKFGNGGGSERFTRISTDKSFVTCEQLSGLFGVAAGTVRDMVRPRGSEPQSLILIPLPVAFELIRKRWNL